MKGKFDGMCMNHSDNNHNEWAEEKKNNIDDYKKGRSQHPRDCGNSNGNSGSGKFITLSSQMYSTLCADCTMYWAEIEKFIRIYNQSN